ncbi:MAG: GNAT family N-acetyltransferase [Verrucomicrobia bacterium]|nr:GNAT family N-acetyltransferase [Verrucomicrobiota bacterium]MBI3868145.1 GNAT family N-acetyltransferase [Verrucomicrobiota bacterium]
MRIRGYTKQDEAGAYAVCLQTGDAGADATRLYDDPRALGDIYVGPYLSLEPELSLVLEDTEGVCGYCLGALDTPRFFGRLLAEWLPLLQELHPEPSGDPKSWTATQRLRRELHHPDLFYPEPIADYPSHMHIDLLPRAQGQGWGRRMVEELESRLRTRGSPGVHLGMWARNERAFRFYTKLGFREITRVGEGDRASLYLGKRL